MAKVNPVRFSTKFQDDETDLLYYGYRYYKASTGTWLRKDPVEERGGLNLYGFVKNDCINKYDSDGRIIVTLVDDSKSPCGGYHVNWDFTLANEASASGYCCSTDRFWVKCY